MEHLLFLGVPILKHIRVIYLDIMQFFLFCISTVTDDNEKKKKKKKKNLRKAILQSGTARLFEIGI